MVQLEENDEVANPPDDSTLQTPFDDHDSSDESDTPATPNTPHTPESTEGIEVETDADEAEMTETQHQVNEAETGDQTKEQPGKHAETQTDEPAADTTNTSPETTRICISEKAAKQFIPPPSTRYKEQGLR
ncbi:hypothetical protein K504DRAFT_496666 [Pleomassaria siparia CBS 279.74]|uniref:Uncharacterized protein n=1 Tax=Pleomassaria siparia CBS 279.74 TaxID=1314801 RepID=A0A6G1KPJ0_9PLEO|nr:hypothetical protein K504DRAFT_496666 [Pleomassaria siparia CBS 279.74]